MRGRGLARERGCRLGRGFQGAGLSAGRAADWGVDVKGRGFSGAGLREGRGFGIWLSLLRGVAFVRGGASRGSGDSDWGVGFRGRGFMCECLELRGFVSGVNFRGRGFLGTAGLLIGPSISGGEAFGLGRLIKAAGLYVERGF